jgi:hypothetical protein
MYAAMLLAVSQFFFWPSPIDWQMNQQNVAIRGTVVEYSTGRAVPGARVSASSAAFDASTVSDSKGEFVFLTLFPGTYYLAASKEGYGSEVYGSIGDVPPELFAGFEYGATIVLR